MIEADKAMRELGARSRIYSAMTTLRPDHLGDIAISILLGRKAVKEGCDVLFFHQGQEAAALFRNHGAFSYFHEAKYDPLTGLVGRAYAILLEEPGRRCPQIVCNSHFTASRIGAALNKDDIPVIYPGVSLDSVEPDGVSEEDQFCYYHSRFHPRKNHELLLEIFSGFPYRLCITGGTWDQKFDGYQKEIFHKALGKPNLLVKGDINEETRRLFLSNASVFLFPARDEPFGLALLEAMAAGKPIVALNSGATGEVLGDTGVLCGRAVDEWRRAITILLSDPKVRRAFGHRSRERAKLFSWTKTAKQMIELAERWS